jgi:hypothetical protein
MKGNMMTDKDLTTHCGIYCGDCPRYKAKFSDMCADLLYELERSHFSELAKIIATKNDKFEKYDEMLSLLKTINALKCELPCRLGGGRGPSCEVIVCSTGRSIEGCWDCDDFEQCKKLDFLKPFCGNAPIKNLSPTTIFIYLSGHSFFFSDAKLGLYDFAIESI